jgi:hypothetical protein
MTQIISNLLASCEHGRLSRRHLVQGLADVDHDSDFDIVGANYDSEHDPHRAPMELWRNLLIERRPNRNSQ